MSIKVTCTKINLNQSSPLPEYFGYIRSGHDPALLVSPLAVAGIVIGLVLFLSCVTIIIGSLRKDGGERDWRLENPSYDGISYATSSFGDLRSVCTGDISPALEFGSYLELSSSYPDYPPCYEDCVGPGTLEVYIPADDPPPYSLEDPHLGPSSAEMPLCSQTDTEHFQKFTGTFVYFIQPVIPEDAIRQILQRVGYSIVSKTEYTIGGKINSEEAKQTAFDLYLSRIQCDNMLWRLNEDKSVSVSLLVHGPGHEAKHRSDPTGQTGKDTREPGEMQNLDLKSNDPSNDDPIKAVGMTVTSTSSQDDISDLSEEKPRYYTKRMDSDEFLYNYSDLNLAQQPIFPLYIKPKKWVAPVSEELNFVKPDGSAKNEGRELAEKITYDLQGNNIDITTFTEQLDPPKSLVSNESPAEVIAPTKQERVVSKLKMLNMSGESLTYPIEETVPPDSAKFSEGSDLGKIEVKWAFLTTKEGTESFASPMSPSSDFSMLNISGKPPIWTPGTDNRLREPPNSTYIPPRAPENEGMRLPNIKAEENHFQVSSPTGDALLVNEYNIHEDTKEDYVMITKKDQN
ncbi:protein BEAN1 isoform X1 [Ranitomeya variabilis]|uniref:protein BEAN1 isoform X1 n=1 Tax=Ranitomeya variabilis TaxID=490064 RepID=UPI0040572F24